MAKKKKTSSKTVRVKARPYRMSVAAPERVRHSREEDEGERKTRLTVICTEKEKRYVKILAAKEGATVSDYLLSKPRAIMPKSRCDYPGCNGEHKPNALTEKILLESERGENLEHHESLEDFWKSIGIEADAED